MTEAAIVKRLASVCAKVALSYVSNAEAAEALASSIGPDAVALKADAADPAAVTAAVNQADETFGKIDILVQNAGVFRTGPVTDFDFDACRQQTAVNVDGVCAGPLPPSRNSQRRTDHRLLVVQR